MKLNKKSIIIFIVIFIILAISFLGFRYKWFLFWQAKKSSNNPPQNFSFDAMKKVVIDKSNIKSLQIQNDLEIKKSDLPEELSNFINQDSQNLVIKRVFYENNVSGFNIQYSLSNISLMDLNSQFLNLANKSKWELLFNKRTNLFALTEIENLKYKVKINQSVKENNIIIVEIEIIAK
jgi:hypothetical protein